MTIAAGIMCSDGIVMCADSQETYGDFKWPVKKLAFPRGTCGEFNMIVSGAGFGPAIDTATQKIFDRTATHMLNRDQTIAVIESVPREIHERDLAYYPTVDRDSLRFQLLIAFTADKRGGLFLTDGSLVRPIQSFEVIGSGEITKFFAHLLYRESTLGWPDMGTAEGSVLAAFLVYLAKSQLTSIGGKSQIAVLSTDGRIRFANTWEAPAWEPIFSECLEIGSQIVLNCADPYFSEKEFGESLNRHNAMLKKLKKSIATKRAYWDKLWHDYDSKGVRLVGHTPMQSATQTSEPEL